MTVVLGIFVNSLAAFALSRMRRRGKKVVLAAIIATLIVPFETFALPLVWWVDQLPWLQVNGFHLALTEGWLDTYRVQVLPFGGPTPSPSSCTSTSRASELDEAAIIDEAGWLDLPAHRHAAVSPAIATAAILTFLPAWNSYLWPLIVVQSENLRPVIVSIQYFFQLNPSWGQIMAYASMITVPVLTLFVAFQRAFVNSIASSGVKADRRGARLPRRPSHSLLCPHAVLQRTLRKAPCAYAAHRFPPARRTPATAPQLDRRSQRAGLPRRPVPRVLPVQPVRSAARTCTGVTSAARI